MSLLDVVFTVLCIYAVLTLLGLKVHITLWLPCTLHRPFNIVCLYWVKSELSVCFEWAEERNDLIQIIGDSETIPQVDPEF